MSRNKPFSVARKTADRNKTRTINIFFRVSVIKAIISYKQRDRQDQTRRKIKESSRSIIKTRNLLELDILNKGVHLPVQHRSTFAEECPKLTELEVRQ